MSSTTDTARDMAARFIALADQHAVMITTSDLHTANFVRAFQYATHMVNGGSYSNGERDVVYTQYTKLQRHFGA